MNHTRSLYWQYPPLYTGDEIKELNKKILDHVLVDHKDEPASVAKTADVKVVQASLIKELELMRDSIIEANKFNFGYHIYPEKLNMNYNVYSHTNKSEYDYHLDMVFENPASDIKLTAILNLSTESYTGGDFYLRSSNELKIPELDSPGGLIIFPSFLLHRVTPVTQGTRITLSAWISGPKFQ